MSNSPDLTAVNTSDFTPVVIYFTDAIINELFAELLAVRGVEARIVSSAEAVPPNARIITEPHLFPALTPSQCGRCLVVGDRSALAGIPSLALTRPLTEEKIERALEQLLGSTANP